MIYKAQQDERSAWEQLKEGWYLGWHSKMQTFYTYDPANKQDTFGSRSLTKAEVRKLERQKKIVAVGTTGEHYKAVTIQKTRER